MVCYAWYTLPCGLILALYSQFCYVFRQRLQSTAVILKSSLHCLTDQI